LGRRSLVALAAVVAGAATLVPMHARGATTPAVPFAPVPRALCGPGSIPERGLQGQVSADDMAHGAKEHGFRCNLEPLSHFGTTGGLRVHRYVDKAGHDCGYYDTSLFFPITGAVWGGDGTGVYVMDMKDPAHPKRTAVLRTPAMQSPHESLSLNSARGLLAADLGNAGTYPNVFDIYDISGDCRHPVLKASLPIGGFGHEGGFSPDGRTFWVANPAGSISAIDVTDPSLPVQIWISDLYRPHGLNVSDDGNTLYYADASYKPGLHVLDVSGIQARRLPLPLVKEIAFLRWESISIPQTAIPVRIDGKPYLVEIDEFASSGGGVLGAFGGGSNKVGAARMIDIADVRRPKVISNMRLEVHMPENRSKIAKDLASSTVVGYTGHYCSVPKRDDPKIVACTFIASGLRVFDIQDPYHPHEVAYFNAPVQALGGNWALSAPAFAPERGEIWYSDGSEGFFALKLTNGMENLLK
jgi:hypothetical protein